MKRENCGACGSDKLDIFLDLGNSPLADAYTATAYEESELFPLQLAVCTDCLLVQLVEVVAPEILFGRGYSFYSSASPPLSAYNALYAWKILSTYKIQAKQLTVEIGCNDGDLLSHFAKSNCKTLGIDPAEGPAKVARERGLEVLVSSFDVNMAREIKAERGPVGVIIANHVLAHVENVSEVLEGIKLLLARNGVAYIEVQYLPDLLVNNSFDMVYHEHRNFFTLHSLENAAKQWGLRILSAKLTNRQAGSLRVVLTHTNNFLASSPLYKKEDLLRSEEWLQSPNAYIGLQGRADRIRERLLDLVYNADRPMIGYGAPAKATTLLNFCGINFSSFERVIDATPAKQGRFIPGTGIQIVSPENGKREMEKARTILLLSWNYASQIMQNHITHAVSGGKWILPFPAPMVF